MKTLIVGGDALLGRALALALPEAIVTSRRSSTSPVRNEKVHYDFLKDHPWMLPPSKLVYLIAAITKFRECELNPDSYTVNVDSQVAIAAHFREGYDAHIVYISSEAATWPGPTAYGMQKRACEAGVLAVCGYRNLSIVRPGQIKGDRATELANLLVEIGINKTKGIISWK